MDKDTSLEQYQDVRKAILVANVLAYQLEHNTTLNAALEACDVKRSTFYRWLGEGAAGPVLEASRQVSLVEMHSSAIAAVPDVMAYVVALATGKENHHRVDPLKAVEMVLRIAQVYSPTAMPPPGTHQVNLAALLPQQVSFRIEAGAPVVGDDGALVIDAECEDVTMDADTD